jgi:cytochrome d ubiquinol oxidase subunit II
MEILWFCIVAVMITVYVVLDGFDIGAGIVHLYVARTDSERRMVIRSVGPVWDGNEVWLLAGGGVLYFAFPGLYASSFSGFYLPLMIVLWLLILRALSIELRSMLDSPTWRPFWDATFFGSSALLAILFGGALGNVVRGVPLDKSGDFFLPLWTNFRVQPEAGILDWYTIPVGILAFLTLTQHGALWVVYKTEGAIRQRAKSLVKPLWALVMLMTIVVTLLSWAVQPLIRANFAAHPWGYVFPALALAGLGLIAANEFGKKELPSFLGSALYIVGMLTSAAFGIFPDVLPAIGETANSLTIYNTAAAPYGLKVGLGWWIPGILLATGYTVYVYRTMSGKVSLEEGGH